MQMKSWGGRCISDRTDFKTKMLLRHKDRHYLTIKGSIPRRYSDCKCIHTQHACLHAKSLQLCLTQCKLIHCGPPGSFVRGILQVRILEWVATSSSRGSSLPRNQTCVSSIACIAGGFFTTSATWRSKDVS